MSKRDILIALEAIDFQTGGLFRDLSLVFNGILKNRQYSIKQIRKAGIDSIIKRYTNIKVTIGDMGPITNACVLPPSVDKNHPLYSSFRRTNPLNDHDAMLLIASSKDVVAGWTDLKTGKVHGVFADMVFAMYIGQGLFKGLKFTGEEIAAIVLHEIGHVFTYCEMASRCVTANYAITTTAEALMGTSNTHTRVEMLETLEDNTHIKISDKQAVVSANDAVTIKTLLVADEVRATRSELGGHVYDERGSEYVADQWAARHGAGRHVVTALDKVYRQSTRHYTHYIFNSYSAQYKGYFTFWVLEIAKLIAVIPTKIGLTSSIDLIFGVMYVLFNNPYKLEYDKPTERFTRLRQQIIESTKHKGLNKEETRVLREDIKVIDVILKDLKDHETLVEYLWKYVLPPGRAQYAAMKHQQNIEKLMANDLFYHAAITQQDKSS